VTERSDGASPCRTRTAWSGAVPRRTITDHAGTGNIASREAASVGPYTSPRSKNTTMIKRPITG
jgi:hypothetical protein